MSSRALAIYNFISLLVLSSVITSIATFLIFGNIVLAWILLVDLIVTAVWIVCGILAYGLKKHFWKLFLAERQYPGYEQKLEKQCVDYGMSGIIGLYSAFIQNRKEKYPLGLCFKMPEELRGQ